MRRKDEEALLYSKTGVSLGEGIMNEGDGTRAEIIKRAHELEKETTDIIEFKVFTREGDCYHGTAKEIEEKLTK
jgi:hypothetical protein